MDKDARINMHDIRLYEELSMNALPALRTFFYDGWVLRFSDGRTNRANSVSMIYPSSLPVEEKVGVCDRMYAGHKLSTVFKMTDGLDCEMDDYLNGLGYEVVHPTYIFTAGLFPASGRHEGDSGERILISADNDPAYNYQGGVLCARFLEDGKSVGHGYCVIDREYAGLYQIFVGENHRRRGRGYAICSELLSAAWRAGARTAYLQVMADNAPAIAMYKKLGFVYCYKYWYRIKKLSKE